MTIFDKNAYRNALTPIQKTFSIDGIVYCWDGGLGSIFHSKEQKPLSNGTVRVIANIPFYVFRCESLGLFGGFKYEIYWTNSITSTSEGVEWIREFKKWVFS